MVGHEYYSIKETALMGIKTFAFHLIYEQNKKNLYITYSSQYSMEKKLVFTLIIFSLVIISGCGKDTEKATGSAVASVCNSPYFEFKAGECCLDKNTNSICDSDETIEEVKEDVVAEETAPVAAEEVEITLEDSCTDTTYFECVTSYITKDELFLKLKTKREGFTHLKGISAMDCKKDFTTKSKAIDGYPIRTDILVSLPCQKYEVGDEVKDVEYSLEYVFYPDDIFINANGEWEGTPRNLQKSSGQVSGTVRSEPKKIL